MNKKYYIILVILLTLALSTKAIANLTLGTTSVTSSGALTLTTNSSTLVLPTTNGTNGQVLTTNGAGTTSWSTVSGGGGGVTNGAGANVIPKSNGTNLVGSVLKDSGAQFSVDFSGSGDNNLSVVYGNNPTVTFGDTPGNGNQTKFELNDSNQMITATINGNGAINLDSSGGIFSAGDLTNFGGGQIITIDAGANTINLDSKGGVTTIGDVGGNANVTTLTLDDSTQSITIAGQLKLAGNSILEIGELMPLTPGLASIGDPSKPFTYLVIGNAANNSSQITGTFTGNRLATLPDRTGTIKVGADYKVYTALLAQSGTSAPVATVLENTLGGTLVWTRSGQGEYIATLSGAFPASKTALPPIGALNFNGDGFFSRLIRVDTNQITLETVDVGAGPTDTMLFNTFIEIRVYP